MKFKRAEFNDSTRKQNSKDKAFKEIPVEIQERDRALREGFDVEKYEVDVQKLHDREIQNGSEDIFEEWSDGTSHYEWTMNIHLTPEEFFAGLPEELLQDPNFWVAVLTDVQMRAKFEELYHEEGLKYLAFIPEAIRRNSKFAFLLVEICKLRPAFEYRLDNPGEITDEVRAGWRRDFPDVEFLFEEYSKPR